nr:hypothetical protein [Tanacetum cinerariifolium]
MIKELDHQSKGNATPRKLVYIDSKKEAPDSETPSASKGDKGLSKGKKSKLIERRSEHQETSTDLEYDEGQAPRNIRVYEGNKDPEDHLSFFLAAAEQEQRLMPIWCKMFHQTLGGAARNWFDDLDLKKIDGIKRRHNESLQTFMDRFKSESLHIKGVPPVLLISAFVHGHGHLELAKKINDKIPKTMDEMFKRVRAFIRGEMDAGSAEMTKSGAKKYGNVYALSQKGNFHFTNKKSKANLGFGRHEFPRTTTLNWNSRKAKPEEIQLKKRMKKQIEKVVTSGKLAQLVRDIRGSNQKSKNQRRNDVKEMEIKGPVIKRFCRQGEQMLVVPDANEEETSELGVND